MKRADVLYSYAPLEVDIEEECPISPTVGAKTLALGICAEYSMICGMYEQSVMYSDRFKEENSVFEFKIIRAIYIIARQISRRLCFVEALEPGQQNSLSPRLGKSVIFVVKHISTAIPPIPSVEGKKRLFVTKADLDGQLKTAFALSHRGGLEYTVCGETC